MGNNNTANNLSHIKKYLLNNYEIIFVDFDGVLSNNLFWQHINNKSSLYKYKKELDNLFVNKLLVNKWMKGNVSTIDILNKLYNDNEVENQIYNQLLFSLKNFELNKSLIQILTDYKKEKKCQLIIATDNMDCFNYLYNFHKLNYTFDAYICSAEIGYLKKDGYIFFKNYNISKSLLIDDKIENGKIFKQLAGDYVYYRY